MVLLKKNYRYIGMKIFRIAMASLLMGIAPLISAIAMYYVSDSLMPVWNAESGELFGVDLMGMIVVAVVTIIISFPVFWWAVSRKERKG